MGQVYIKIVDNRRLYDKLIQEVSKGFEVELGYFEGEVMHPSGVDLALIALSNEFGIKSLNIPERSFFRGAIDKHIDKINKKIKNVIGRILDLKITWKHASKELAEYVIRIINFNIYQAKSWATELKPRTINAKGHSNPLIHTGTLRNGMKWKKKRRII